MPRYEYTCDTADCGGTKTIICKVADKPALVQCPTCGCVMDQDLSGIGQAFKGPGWTPKFGPRIGES
jgi:putative FmdB family regulatory protein